jgi:choline kinase
MRAIILAAGQGTRLSPLTDDRPKCLVPFLGKPILDHVLASLAAAGIDDVAVVTGYRADMIAARGLTTRHNPDFERTNMVHSLFCAEDLMTDDDLLIVYGDIVFHPRLALALKESPAPFALAVNTRWRELWERRMTDPLSDAETLKLDSGGNIVELGKRPKSYDEVQGQFTGLIRIARDTLPAVRRYYAALDRSAHYDGKDFANMYMTSFLQAVIDGLMPVKAVPMDGGWLEIDSIDDLRASEAMAAEVLT